MTLDNLMIHTCTLQLRKAKQALAFNQGTAAPAAGSTLTGATSGCQATVDEVILASGSWAGGDAAGTLVLKNIAPGGKDKDQPFQAGELLGTARANGTMADHELDTGEKALYWVTGPTMKCRFATNPKAAKTTNLGEYTQAPVKVYLPTSFLDSFTTEAEVKITTTSQGFNGTYLVLGAYPAPTQAGIHHVEADLQRVPYG